MIAEEALLVVTDLVGLQHLLAALRARHHEGGRGRPSSMVGRAGERGIGRRLLTVASSSDNC